MRGFVSFPRISSAPFHSADCPFEGVSSSLRDSHKSRQLRKTLVSHAFFLPPLSRNLKLIPPCKRYLSSAYKLNCVEATAAALYITGFDQQASLLLSKFSWGHSFWEVNGQIIERYKKCTTPESVMGMQETIIREMEKQDDERSE